MVHFVGAGSGAADLITVRGMNLLKEADCVIYAGSLVSPELLKYCREGVDIYNSAEMNLEEVLFVIRENINSNKTVVRLHTGDPSLYGAIGEQIEYLKKNNIPYDVTPGVTAAFAAAASMGQELTLPGISQTVIFTRVEGRTPMPEAEKIAELAEHGATMAIYLSATRVDELKSELLKGKYSENTPVAICYKVSWPEEKIFISTIAEMDSLVKKEKLNLTTLFIVGDVINSNAFEKSRLYAADFSTCYRSSKEINESNNI